MVHLRAAPTPKGKVFPFLGELWAESPLELTGTFLSFSQYLAFFEFNNRLEAILSKAYVYR